MLDIIGRNINDYYAKVNALQSGESVECYFILSDFTGDLWSEIVKLISDGSEYSYDQNYLDDNTMLLWVQKK